MNVTFKAGIPLVYAWKFARAMGCVLEGKLINNQYRVTMRRI